MGKGQLPLAIFTGAGLAVILWLLMSSPDSGRSSGECRPALNVNLIDNGSGFSDFEDSKASVARFRDLQLETLNVCSSKQNNRLAGGLLLSLPTGVAAGMLIARRRDARPADAPPRQWVPPQSVIDDQNKAQGDKDQ
ncbi:hypothetical protein ACIBLA_26665 [Streptomyces sp. NPDC050433]|uniref:hypothetical protein n=1 Tax=unclassified Streptomyces TaxID=2593676 RepID=UPI00341F1F0E